MPTRGYYVVCYQGIYFVTYIPCEASTFGDDITDAFLRISPGNIRACLQDMRRSYARKLERALSSPEKRESLRCNFAGSGVDYVSYSQPRRTLFIEWVYEINLDDLIFRVNRQPFFYLNNLPPISRPLRSMGNNHYGHCIPSSDIPRQYHYNPFVDLQPTWLKAASHVARSQPTVDPEFGPTVEAIHEMLHQREGLAGREAVCLRMLETTAGITLKGYRGHLYALANPTKIQAPLSWELTTFACMFLHLAFCPVLHAKNTMTEAELASHRQLMKRKIWWPRKHVAVCFAPCLDDGQSLRAAEWRLVRSFENEDVYGDVFGVVFSVLHIAILRYNKSSKTCTHTGALQFLPGPFAREPSTPGITALVRLGQRSMNAYDEEMFYARKSVIVHDSLRQHVLAGTTTDCNGIHNPDRGKICRVMPALIWAKVAEFLEDGWDLSSFALVSHQTLSASLPSLKYPQLRIPTSKISVHTVVLSSLGPSAKEHFKEYIEKRSEDHLHLYAGVFYTKFRSYTESGDDKHTTCSEALKLIAIIADGPEYCRFKSLGIGRLRVPEMDRHECHFHVLEGPMAKQDSTMT